MPYNQLTLELRYTIFLQIQMQTPKNVIAKLINVNVSTIFRELKRNTINGVYNYKLAHKQTLERRKIAKKPFLLDEKLQKLIIEKLQLFWSPEQISGRFKRDKIANISHQTIYNWISQDKIKGGIIYTYLRRKRKYKKRITKDKYGIVGRVKIDKRPPEVEERSRLGDWEIDTIYSTAGDTSVIVTAVERKSRFLVASMLKSRDASALASRLCFMLRRYNPLTITSDNGTEFAGHKYVSKKLNCGFYFANPYHPWERGTNENTNGLLRQFLPSGKSFKGQNNKLSKAVNLINNRPRKCMNYLTSLEALELYKNKRE